MAADTTDKERARAIALKNAAESFMDGLRALQKVRADGVSDGLTITDAALAGSAAAHIAQADIGTLMNTIDQLPGLIGAHLTNISKASGK